MDSLMKKNISIQVKAAFLLFVFALNTAVGFACSIGMDMGFNATHHKDGEASSIHVHADGKKHFHQPKSAQQHKEENSEKRKTVVVATMWSLNLRKRISRFHRPALSCILSFSLHLPLPGMFSIFLIPLKLPAALSILSVGTILPSRI